MLPTEIAVMKWFRQAMYNFDIMRIVNAVKPLDNFVSQQPLIDFSGTRPRNFMRFEDSN